MPIIEFDIHPVFGPIASILVSQREEPIDGLIDTGAAKSGVAQGWGERLGLVRSGPAVVHSVTSVEEVQTYYASISFVDATDGSVHMFDSRLHIIEYNSDLLGIPFLVGRDILERCIFAYSGPQKRISLSF